MAARKIKFPASSSSYSTTGLFVGILVSTFVYQFSRKSSELSGLALQLILLCGFPVALGWLGSVLGDWRRRSFERQCNERIDKIQRYAHMPGKDDLIPDAAFLPQPKAELLRVFDEEEDYLRQVAQAALEANCSDVVTNARLRLHILDAARVFLEMYVEIDEEDREAVAYFNQFKSASAIPSEKFADFNELLVKYMKRGIEQRSIGHGTSDQSTKNET